MDLETLYSGGWEDYQITCMKNKANNFENERQVVSPKSDFKSIVYAKSIVFLGLYVLGMGHDFRIFKYSI